MSHVPSQSDAKGVNGWTSNWPVPFLYRGCHWTGQIPSLRKRRTQCKPFVAMHCNKWTSNCKTKDLLNICMYRTTCLFFVYMPNLSLAFIIFLTIRSVRDLRPGS